MGQWRKSRGEHGGHVPPKCRMGNGNASCPPNMAGISLHKRQRIRLYLLIRSHFVFVKYKLSQLCQVFYRGQFCELDFQILDHKQYRPSPKFPIKFTPLSWGHGSCGISPPGFLAECRKRQLNRSGGPIASCSWYFSSFGLIKVNVQHLYSTASRICSFIGAVRHRHGRCSD